MICTRIQRVGKAGRGTRRFLIVAAVVMALLTLALAKLWPSTFSGFILVVGSITTGVLGLLAIGADGA
jgi:hypothetical protein